MISIYVYFRYNLKVINQKSDNMIANNKVGGIVYL